MLTYTRHHIIKKIGAVPDNTKMCYVYGMKKSRISKLKQNRLIEHFVAGTTARCAAELIDVNRKTAAYLL